MQRVEVVVVDAPVHDVDALLPTRLSRPNVVLMRTTVGGSASTLYPRVDHDYLDPLHFRLDSCVGCAGIVNAACAGTGTIAMHRQRRRR